MGTRNPEPHEPRPGPRPGVVTRRAPGPDGVPEDNLPRSVGTAPTLRAGEARPARAAHGVTLNREPGTLLGASRWTATQRRRASPPGHPARTAERGWRVLTHAAPMMPPMTLIGLLLAVLASALTAAAFSLGSASLAAQAAVSKERGPPSSGLAVRRERA